MPARAPKNQYVVNLLMRRLANALLVFTLLAFGLKSWVYPETLDRFTPLVIAHALAMIAWLALLANQADLARMQKFGTHRAFGRASIVLVAIMVVTGTIISINIGRELGRIEVTIVNLAAFVTFLPLYGAAIHFARHKQFHSHRQAMLIATLALMTPAYARIVQVLGLPDPIAIGIQPPVTIAIALTLDRLAIGRITRDVLYMLGYSVAVVLIMVTGLIVFVGLDV